MPAIQDWFLRACVLFCRHTRRRARLMLSTRLPTALNPLAVKAFVAVAPLTFPPCLSLLSGGISPLGLCSWWITGGLWPDSATGFADRGDRSLLWLAIPRLKTYRPLSIHRGDRHCARLISGFRSRDRAVVETTSRDLSRKPCAWRWQLNSCQARAKDRKTRFKHVFNRGQLQILE